MARIALGIEYDGANYVGWERQDNGPSIQAALESAIGQVAGESVRCICAGRTDAGVHASGQVVHFDCSVVRTRRAWVFGSNTHLPRDIAVRWAVSVDSGFHARFSARTRHYRYIIVNRSTRPALLLGRVGHVPVHLSEERMQTAANGLLGRHDFSAFRASRCQANNPVRVVHRFSVRRHGDFIIIDVIANAFLHHMVRNLVGSLVLVGQEKREPDWLNEVLLGGDRRKAGPTMSAQGLYLLQVHYPHHDTIPGVSVPPVLW